MKNIFFIVVSFIALFTSCESTNSEPDVRSGVVEGTVIVINNDDIDICSVTTVTYTYSSSVYVVSFQNFNVTRTLTTGGFHREVIVEHPHRGKTFTIEVEFTLPEF